MSADGSISRRSLLAGVALAGLGARRVHAQGFAGLGRDADGFAQVEPGKRLTFPADLGPHPEYRIEWWYVTANLTDRNGTAYGMQWTLFRQAMRPGPQQEGWANQQIWMGHAAATTAQVHYVSETFARGGIGEASAEAEPFRAWIDSWEMRGLDGISATTISPLEISASGHDFSTALRLTADKPLVLQGDAGFSRKSQRGQASYYFSQPFFTAAGTLTLDNKPVDVSGMAWMDREWSSQPLASYQIGWDWFALHLNSGDKLMLFRLRQTEGADYFAGNWIGTDGQSVALAPGAITMKPTAFTAIGSRKLPTQWRIAVPDRKLAIDTTPLNARSWMTTSFPYWEGPVAFQGSHSGVGYLEMTGY